MAASPAKSPSPKKRSQEFIKYDFLYKIVLVGDSGVGKSNLLSRFKKNEFTHESKSTIGVEFASKLMSIEGKIIAAQIWDTAGQERYQAITSTYFRGAVGALLVYDITNYQSFKHTDKWLFQLKECTNNDVEVMLVGNKADMDFIRQVPITEAKSFCKASEMTFVEASALSGSNVDKAFTELIHQIFIKKSKEHLDECIGAPELAVGRSITITDGHSNDHGTPSSTCSC